MQNSKLGSRRTAGVQRFAASISASALVVSVAACDPKPPERTVGQEVDRAVATVAQTAREVGTDIKDAGRDMKAEVQKAGKDVKQAAGMAGDKVRAVAGDAAITAEVNAQLARDAELSALRINVDTDGGRVILSGTAPTTASRDRAKGLASSVSGVRSVDNRLVVEKS